MSNNQSADIRRARKRGRPRKLSNATPVTQPESKPLTVTFKTAKQLSGLGMTSLWALAKAERLDVVRVGRRTLIRYASLERLLEPSHFDTLWTEYWHGSRTLSGNQC